ncbi:hypothetical protein GCM10025867_49240 (plasmid) [Frondihabitans sucicola]|uniref:Uncharacterized protein n=1 Tax=Frondihabitans sucicola TaxID=1268041 RepID=A0ABM8GWC3_9MICO|nr:hypothetical protein [Frondihabitans sucicola]BDZ52683.1 hypothetical protein GCM10025867_49240 [Frondihabitans sucicola]
MTNGTTTPLTQDLPGFLRALKAGSPSGATMRGLFQQFGLPCGPDGRDPEYFALAQASIIVWKEGRWWQPGTVGEAILAAADGGVSAQRRDLEAGTPVLFSKGSTEPWEPGVVESIGEGPDVGLYRVRPAAYAGEIALPAFEADWTELTPLA